MTVSPGHRPQAYEYIGVSEDTQKHSFASPFFRNQESRGYRGNFFSFLDVFRNLSFQPEFICQCVTKPISAII